jgi:hypothetical protein
MARAIPTILAMIALALPAAAAPAAATDPVTKACGNAITKHCKGKKTADERLACLREPDVAWRLDRACYVAALGNDADPDDWRMVCGTWIDRRCRSVTGTERVQACLRKHHRELDSRCLFFMFGECDPETYKPGMRCGDYD